MIAGEFVGRVCELERLGNFLDKARAGTAITAVLAGEPGVGKSRLLSEFAEVARAAGTHVLRGACIELGGGVIPYAPLIEALRLLVRACGEAEGRRLTGPAWPELAALIADFTGVAPAGRKTDGSGSQLQIFGAVLRVLDHLGADAPVVLIFEDMHWADPSTLDLVSYLTRAKSNERTLLICSHRTGLMPGHPLRSLLAEPDFARRTEHLELPRFTEGELRRFLNGIGPVDRDLVRVGFELSEGNAFFAEQLMISGALTDPGASRIPESINELMLSRIRLLGKDATRVMRVAATAARRVSDRLLTAVCKLDDDALDEALRECLGTGMLVADPADDTYSVRHALLREAVYESLIPRERRRLHTEMAEAITEDTALSLAEDMSAAVELAHHWYCARRHSEALAAAARAGAVTTQMRAFHEAETQYKRVLRLWGEVKDPDRLAGITHEQVLAAAADAARWAGHVRLAVRLVIEAIGEVDAATRPRRRGELYERLGSYQWEAGATDESAHAYQEAARLLANEPPDAVKARVLAGLATTELRAGRYTEGLRQAERAIGLAERIGAPAEKGRALNTAGVALTMLERADEGVRMLREALRIAEQTDHLEDLFRAYGNLAVALEHIGDLPGSVEVALDGLKRTRRLGLANARQGGVLANNASAVMFLLGRWNEATDLLDEALLDHPPVLESAYMRLTLAEINVARGRFAEATALIDEVREQYNVDPRFVGAMYACEAELSIWRGDPALAQDMVERGLAAIRGTENLLVDLRLCAIGTRAAADRCAREIDRAATLARSAELVDQACRAVAGRTALQEVKVLTWLCAAENDRALGTDSPTAWEGIAAAWDDLGRPYPAAYARWRCAVACVLAGDRVGAARPARAAYHVAERLHAEPLRTEIEKLVPAARTSPDDNESWDRPHLTPRELEVYRMLADGLSNHDIANTLTIADSTVAVHIRNILAKLDVSRPQAIVLAHRTHFFARLDDPAGD
ncbi:MAG TPA: AAA family ATPase [Pseudonocardiaceae bacterium]|nr:AAA family ATPase [Pseudonocardiaceae bacterium]